MSCHQAFHAVGFPASSQGTAATAAREAGASCIIMTGLSADHARLALARELGAHHTIDVEREDLLEAVAHHTGGFMADLVIDCASGGPATITSAIIFDSLEQGQALLKELREKGLLND